MAVNLSALSNITTAATALSNLVLVTPGSTVGYQPQNPSAMGGLQLPAPPSFVFSYEGENKAIMESDITDHYSETNVPIEDNIALKPEIISVRGFIGELTDIAPFGLQTLQAAADRLTTIGAYTPKLTATALIAYDEAFFLYQVAANAANSAVSVWNTASNLAEGGDANEQSVVGANGITLGTTQNNQQTLFGQIYGYWQSKTLFTVQTPWAVFTDMAILKFAAIQDPETDTISDFELTFKKIRYASDTSLLSSSVAGRLITQSASPSNQGTSQATEGPSFASEFATV